MRAAFVERHTAVEVRWGVVSSSMSCVEHIARYMCRTETSELQEIRRESRTDIDYAFSAGGEAAFASHA